MVKKKKDEARQILYKQQNGRCYWCNCSIILKGKKSNKATIDHLIPQCKNGSSVLKNIVLACERCNLKRGDTMTDPISNEVSFLKLEEIEKDILGLLNSNNLPKSLTNYIQNLFADLIRSNCFIVESEEEIEIETFFVKFRE